MTQMDKIIKILNHYGAEQQKLKAAEELTELQEIILKDVNKGQPPVGILGEIADVRIMLTQLEIIYEVDPWDLRDAIDYKLDRTMMRMEGEE